MSLSCSKSKGAQYFVWLETLYIGQETVYQFSVAGSLLSLLSGKKNFLQFSGFLFSGHNLKLFSYNKYIINSYNKSNPVFFIQMLAVAVEHCSITSQNWQEEKNKSRRPNSADLN